MARQKRTDAGLIFIPTESEKKIQLAAKTSINQIELLLLQQRIMESSMSGTELDKVRLYRLFAQRLRDYSQDKIRLLALFHSNSTLSVEMNWKGSVIASGSTISFTDENGEVWQGIQFDVLKPEGFDNVVSISYEWNQQQKTVDVDVSNPPVVEIMED